MRISILIPYYRESEHIYDTTKLIVEALCVSLTTDQYEIIILDDGSNDLGANLEDSLCALPGVKIQHLAHKGRYQTRLAGLSLAQSEHVLLCDSRVKLNLNSLKFLTDPSVNIDQPRNGHVLFDSKAKFWMVFWESVSRIVWSQVFQPHFVSGVITRKNYNSWPKGTGLFYARRDDLLAAMNSLNSFFNDDKMSNDDTLVLQHLAEQRSIIYDVNFSATYLPRQKMNKFLTHMYEKGTKAIDGFGHSLSGIAIVIVTALITPPLFFGLLIFFQTPLLKILEILLFLLMILEIFIGLISFVKKLPFKFIASLLLMLPVAAPAYLGGIYRGVFMAILGFFRKELNSHE